MSHIGAKNPFTLAPISCFPIFAFRGNDANTMIAGGLRIPSTKFISRCWWKNKFCWSLLLLLSDTMHHQFSQSSMPTAASLNWDLVPRTILRAVFTKYPFFSSYIKYTFLHCFVIINFWFIDMFFSLTFRRDVFTTAAHSSFWQIGGFFFKFHLLGVSCLILSISRRFSRALTVALDFCHCCCQSVFEPFELNSEFPQPLYGFIQSFFLRFGNRFMSVIVWSALLVSSSSLENVVLCNHV